MAADLLFSIDGEDWRLLFTNNLADNESGKCDRDGKIIYIREGMSFKDTLGTIIHELIHAALWMADDDWVADCEKDFMEVISHPTVTPRIGWDHAKTSGHVEGEVDRRTCRGRAEIAG